MKSIYLPAIGIEFGVGDNTNYYDDGLVSNVMLHTQKLRSRYSSSFYQDLKLGVMQLQHLKSKYVDGNKRSNNSSDRGQALFSYNPYYSLEDAILDNGLINIHTYVQTGYNNYTTTFIKGHEEGHVLFNMGELDSLKKILSRFNICPENLENESEEVICNVAGFSALLKNFPGISSLELQIMNSDILKMVDWLDEHSTWKFKKTIK